MVPAFAARPDSTSEAEKTKRKKKRYKREKIIPKRRSTESNEELNRGKNTRTTAKKGAEPNLN